MISKEKCCGCSACVVRCPKSNISMNPDEEGFLYPYKKDSAVCGACTLCEAVCFYNRELQSTPPKSTYACKSNNDDIRMNSSSGGIFSLIAEFMLTQGGVIFGAAFDDECVLKHDVAEGEDYKKFRRSKYVQSDMKDNYIKAKGFLDEGRHVLFTGTPCQIAGLQRFLNKVYTNLLCVDFICHGVPSPLMLRLHLEEIETQAKSKAVDMRFRTKEGAWKKCTTTTAIMHDGTEIVTKRDPFMLGFLQNLYLRPACKSCMANNYRSGADITIGDYWGAETANRKFDDDNGISLTLVHSDKGREIFNEVKIDMQVIDADLNHALILNPNLVSSSRPHQKRDEFFALLRSGVPFSHCVNKFTKTHIEIVRELLSPSQVRHIQLFLSKIKKET